MARDISSTIPSRTQVIFVVILAVFSIGATCALLLPGKNASALSGSEFRAGNIIDDAVFYNKSTMTPQQIQNFLNANLPTCDIWGTQASGHSGYVTRADWGRANGNPPPYTCLKDYWQDVPAVVNSGSDLCKGSVSAGNKSAAQIIYDVSQACGTNPQTLLTLLQKEQSLIKDEWPWPGQYRSATGYGCPDTAACDSQYYGFFNQVYQAAKAFNRYATNPTGYNYRAGRNNTIYFHPGPCQTRNAQGVCTKYYGNKYNASGASIPDITYCGSTSVYIENQATANLYIYTPYQPNASALNNLYGSGDNCGAYGNRNFWRIFNDWFGSTHAEGIYPRSSGLEIFRLYNPTKNSFLLTTDPYEVAVATSKGKFDYDGVVGLQVAGGVPVYRLQKSGSYLYTSSTDELNTAKTKYGFSVEGVAFAASTEYTADVNLPMHRLSAPIGGYFYTVSEAERDAFYVSSGYNREGVGFYVNIANQANLTDIYRLSHPTSGYLYSPSVAEKENAVANYGFTAEGVAFRARAGFTLDNLPVYRLAGNYGYIYTIDFKEKNAAVKLGYRYEGMSYFSYAKGNLGAGIPIYRLAHPDGRYLYTASVAESDSAVKNYGYRLEGLAFRVP